MRLYELLNEYEYPKTNLTYRTKSTDLYNYDARSDSDDEDEDVKNTLNKKDTSRRILKDPKVKHLGTGYFSSVYQHEDNPHDVLKGSRPRATNKYSSGSDGFYHLIKQLAKDEHMRANPYFPRVRSIRIIKAGDKKNYLVRLERLFPLSTLSTEEASFLAEKMFTEESIRKIIKEWYKIQRYYMKSIPVGEFSGNMLADLLLTEEWSPGTYEFNDPYLQEAFVKLKQISLQERVAIDLNNTNIMVRRTPYGPQLVFSDPLGEA